MYVRMCIVRASICHHKLCTQSIVITLYVARGQIVIQDDLYCLTSFLSYGYEYSPPLCAALERDKRFQVVQRFDYKYTLTIIQGLMRSEALS